MDLTKSYEFFKPEMLQGKCHIIGCGSVGSTLAENLARFGVTDFVLYDFDLVESHNIVNQMFTLSDIGRPKTEATADMIKAINPDCSIKLCSDGWNGQKLAGYVFLAVDDIALRRRIVEENKGNAYIKAMFDFRTGLEAAQHFAADWSDSKSRDTLYKSMNFTHEEAKEETPQTACGVSQSVATTIRMIVAAGVGNFVNFVKGRPIKKMILVDAFSFCIDAV